MGGIIIRTPRDTIRRALDGWLSWDSEEMGDFFPDRAAVDRDLDRLTDEVLGAIDRDGFTVVLKSVARAGEDALDEQEALDELEP